MLKIRLFAFLTDMLVIGFLVIPIAVLGEIFQINWMLKFVVILGYILIILKDLYSKDGSFGKKKYLLKIEFLQKTSTQKVMILKVLRNLFLFIWPAEVIIMSLTNGKRIGDLVIGSEVKKLDS